ncbi:MAG: EAL domain-containing protein, partial [Hyphomicrobiales bacterium]|nr:EAL domain-containing protein [Hyphomicrobiales bacterium]
MERLTATIIAICMVAIAGSFGAVIYRVAGMSVGEAAMAAFALLLVFILLESRKVRDRDRKTMFTRLDDMDRFLGTLSREVQHLETRFAALETGADSRLEDGLKAFSDEIESLAAGMGELSESISAIEEKLRQPLPAAVAAAPAALTGEAVAAHPPEISDDEQKAAELARAVRGAIEGERIDLCLQSIVTLPQRKVAFYEALARLRDDNGRQMMPDDFLPVAAAEGMLPALDSHMLFRAVQVLRRLNTRNRGLGM